MRWIGAALVAALLLASCSSDPESPAPAGATPTATESATAAASPTGTPTPPCAEEIDEGEHLPGAVEGDVDGDGRVDDVFLLRSESTSFECRNLLVVEGEAGTYAVSVDNPELPSTLPQPRINRLAYVDDDGGAEVLVDVETGASTQFLGMFTIVEGSLVRVQMPDEADIGDLLPYGGSVGHIEASNCPTDHDADVVIAVATPRGPRYLIERTYYDLQGTSLVEVAREEERLPVEALSQEHDYVTSPFGACVVNP